MLEESIEPAQLRSAAVPRREEAATFRPGGGERGCSLEEGHVVEAPIASHEMEIHWGIQYCTPNQQYMGVLALRSEEGLKSICMQMERI